MITKSKFRGNETLMNEQLSSNETNYLDVTINPDLCDDKIQLRSLIYRYRDVFSSIPGTTHLGEHRD